MLNGTELAPIEVHPTLIKCPMYDPDGEQPLGGTAAAFATKIDGSKQPFDAALERVAGPSARQLVRFEPDAAIDAIVASWPGGLDAARPLALGFQAGLWRWRSAGRHRKQ